jgi:O-antigen/teichoic acid export membrane protein
MSIGRHTAYNLLGALVPAGLSLLVIPSYIRLIGDARFGVLALLWAFSGYFGLLDLGLGRAAAQSVAALGDASPETRATAFWTALSINAGLGAAGSVAIWLAASWFFGHVVTIEAPLGTELSAALGWLASTVPISLLAGVTNGALEGRSRFLELSLIAIVGSALGQILPLGVAFARGPELAGLVAAVVCARLLTLGLAFWRCRIHVFGTRPPSFCGRRAKALLRFGGWVTVSSVVGPLMVSLDRFVIGAGAGAKAVTSYTVPFQLGERANVLALSLASALFPRLALAGREERQRLVAEAIGALAVLTTPPFVAAILLVEPFFRLWLGPEFAARANVADQLLLVGFWCNGLAATPYAELQASGRPDLVAKCHLIELAPYFLLLFLGLGVGGLPGAALAFSLRAFGDLILLLHLGGDLKTCLGLVAAPLALLLLAVTAAVAGTTLPVDDIWRWAVSAALVVATMAWSWRRSPAAFRDAGRLVVDRLLARRSEATR